MRGRIDAARTAWVVLAVAMALAAVLILRVTRGTTLWFDDWSWALTRRSGLHSLLASYNGHFSLVSTLVYRGLYATSGISSYVPFRIVLVVGHLVCVGLVFAYARRRVGEWPRCKSRT